MRLLDGQIFEGRYRIKASLEGGLFEVYRAEDLDDVLGRDVIIKRLDVGRLRADHTDDEGFHEQAFYEAMESFTSLLKIEAAAQARLEHPGIVNLFAFELEEQEGLEVPYLVLEFVRGSKLYYPGPGRIGGGHAFWESCLPFLNHVDQLLGIVAEVHKGGVVHADLKPDNILVWKSTGGASFVRVIDFGSAVLSSMNFPARLRHKNQFLCTPDFAAPEQAAQKEVTAKSDQFSVGVMLYEGLGGGNPLSLRDPLTAAGRARVQRFLDLYQDRLTRKQYLSIAAWLEDQQNILASGTGSWIMCQLRAVTPVPRLPGYVPSLLADVVEEATALDPGQRFGDVSAMGRALNEAARVQAEELFEGDEEARRRISSAASYTGSSPNQPTFISRIQWTQDNDPWTANLDNGVVVLPGGPESEQLFERLFSPVIKKAGLEPVHLRVDRLRARRLSQKTVELLEYARVVLWDISGLHKEAMRLLLFHHRLGRGIVVRSGTSPLPGEVAHLLAADYGLSFFIKGMSRRRLTRLLDADLKHRWMLPAQARLWTARSRLARGLQQATRCVAQGDLAGSVAGYRDILPLVPQNSIIQHRLATLEMQQAESREDWLAVAADLRQVLAQFPGCAAAWRDRGVALSKAGRLRTAYTCLCEAISLDEKDYDAWASLGGLFQRRARRRSSTQIENYARALECYGEAAEVSRDHPYPVLNMIRIKAMIEPGFRQELARGRLDRRTRGRLQDVVSKRSRQAAKGLDGPWCFFDLCEAHLYLGKPEAAYSVLDRAERGFNRDQLETFNTSLKSLQRAGIELAGLPALRVLLTGLSNT